MMIYGFNRLSEREKNNFSFILREAILQKLGKEITVAKTGYPVKGHMSSFIHFTADSRKTGYSTATGGKGFFHYSSDD